MAKQLTEREKFLQEIAALKKVGLLLLELPPEKRQTVMSAVLGKLDNPTPGRRPYKLKKKAGRKPGRKAAGK